MKEDRAQITENRRQTINELLCSRAEELIKSGNDGISAARQLTDIVDNVLVSAYNSELGTLNSELDLSLVAVGGYGRRELAPYSDIDIMLLARNRDNLNKELAHKLLYRFWDMGLNISHCFRTMNECIEDSANDLKTRTSLIETRFLAGKQDVFDEFKRDVYQKFLFKDKRNFVGKILREIDKRHLTYGDSVYLLEPNVKEGRGGLRDIHTISWLAKTALRMNNIEGLREVLPESDYKHFIKAYDFLLKTRFCLHFISKRKNDVLSFEFQDAVSKMLEFKDTRRFLSAEILMRLYYRKAKYVVDALNRIKKTCCRQYFSFPFNFKVKRITEDFYISKNEIIVKDINVFKNSDKILEAFYIYAITGRKFSYQVKEAIRNRFLFINKKTRTSKKAAIYFLEILKSSRVYETLSEMHDAGILDRFIPEFGSLRHLVIYEPYHRYTVDEHTLIAIKNLELLKQTKHAKLRHLSDVMKNVKQEVLYLSILLHDIGKGITPMYLPLQIMGFKEDLLNRHEEIGYRMLKGVIERFNIELHDRQMIEFIVKNHILLSRLTLTRDPDTPETIAQLSEIVENEENLNALYLMTYADMAAVNPYFWTEWKAYLFQDVYTKTRDHLRGIRGYYLNISDIKLKELVEDMPDRYLISNTIDTINADYQMIMKAKDKRPVIAIEEKTARISAHISDGSAEITIAANNMPGLFTTIVGVLGFRGLNILRARLYTGKSGIVIDKILISNWRDMWWQGMEDQIKEELKKAILSGEDTRIQGLKGEKKNILLEHMKPRTIKPFFRFESFVEIDNETSDKYTILELFSPDRLGLLYDISSQLYKYDVEIISAVINTEDRVAQDVFYLQYNNGKLNADVTMNVLYAAWSVIE